MITYALAALCCFGPLALYLCWLSSVNRRPKPTVMPGAWDFAFTLAGLSGFLVVGGILLMDFSNRLLLRGNFNEIYQGWQKYWHAWLLISLGYLIIVIGLASWTLARRSRWLSVYNIDLAEAERALEAAMQSAGLPLTRIGYGWLDGTVGIEPYRGGSHCTFMLKIGDKTLRHELERHLWIELAKAPPAADNTAAGWFTSLAVGHTFLVVGIVGFASYILFFR